MKRKSSQRGDRPHTLPAAEGPSPCELRIIGGAFRGRKIAHTGDPRTRPMKDRVREAVFNLLGQLVRDKHAIDLFAGTGALGLEALSRGAARATFIEQHFPTANLVRRNAENLGCADRVEVIASDTFFWAAHEKVPSAEPWLVFCSPPYDFYVKRREPMRALLQGMARAAPRDSVLVVEADERLDFHDLPPDLVWDTRRYPPALIAIGVKA